MSKHFGKDPLVFGAVYEFRDLNAQAAHRSPVHVRCVVRTAVLEDGCVRVGVAFHGPNDSSFPHLVDANGFALEPTCFVFPSMLRAV